MAASLLLTTAATVARAQERPDVLLITIDTLRGDALGIYGGRAATPALDRLVRRGVRFDNAVAHAVLTLPSHTSILSGLDPSRHDVHDNVGFRASSDLDTWAERLKRAGYATAAFVGGFPLDSQFGLAQGFDLYDDFYGHSASDGFYFVERRAEDVVVRARRWIETQRGPWFAWVHVYDPHAPYEAPAPFGVEYANDAYAGEIAYTDAALASLLSDAERTGALVVVTSDHGEALGDHGERTHGIFAYGATLRVPLIVAGMPRLRAGTAVVQRVGHADILPTVLELLGISQEGTEGASLVAAMTGVTGSDIGTRPVYFESLGPNLTRNWAPLRGIFRGNRKFIDLPLPELYDLEHDRAELDNLSSRRATWLHELKTALDAHLEGAATGAGPITEDAATLARLRALGYVGGAGPANPGEYGVEDDPKRLIGLENDVQRAVAAADAGDTAAATRLLTGVLQQRPDFVVALTLLASIEHEQGNTEAAIDRLSDAAAFDWRTADLLVRLGAYLRLADRRQEAVAVLEQARAEEPENLDVLNLLAAVHVEVGATGAADEILSLALELDPTHPGVHANRGMMLLPTRPAAAAEAFRTALRYDPELADAHNGLGGLAFERGSIEAAIEHWRRAIAADERHFRAMSNLGIRLVELNRFEEAVGVLDRLIAGVPATLRDEYQIAAISDMVRRIKHDYGIQ